MPAVAIYRCLKCGTEYRPLDAGARQFLCCGVSLERFESTRREENNSKAHEQIQEVAGNAAESPAGAQPIVVEIIPPRDNTVDALAVETLLASLATHSRFSLEIAGDANGRHFLVRAPKEILAHVQRQVQAVYDQVSFRPLAPEHDPAMTSVNAVPNESHAVMARMALRRPVYLPLRTYRDGDFREADPIRGLLGAFGDFVEGECALSQIILSSAPPHWADRYQGSTRRIDQSFGGEAMTFATLVRQFVSIGAVMFALAVGLWAFFSFMQRAWLSFVLAAPLFIGTLLGVIFLYTFFIGQTNVDPTLVQRKVATSAYDVNIRLIAVGKTRARAEDRLRALVGAYRQFDLSSGNALLAHRAVFDPRELVIERWNWLEELFGHVTRLNVSELASLWHLPFGQGTPFVGRNLTKRILPLPSDVSEGILVGHAVHQGQTVPVHLATNALWHHIFMVAKTQKGKSTLMTHLATAAMSMDTAVVVIDPHGDLARSLLSLVPRSRTGDVLYIDFSDAKQFVGLNLLDMAQGRNADAIVSNIIHVGELIWSDYWGPRMEDALRMALRTLLCANEILAREHQKQFTLVDIPSVYELPNFRHRLLQQYVRDPEILQWWSGYFERLYESLRMDVINPVLTKIHRFSTHSVVRNIVAQSNSTVNFRELLDKRRILLVNTATGVIGPDAGGLLGAVLVDYINFAVREQMAVPDPSTRARVVVVVDEFQSIPGVDYPGLLAELQKMGASFILATQALGQLDAISDVLRPAILSNMETLFVFQTSADDADILRHELDDEVIGTDIINLSDHSCYIKTQVGRDRLPVMHIETLPPRVGEPRMAEQILMQMTRYTRSGKIVESERRAFQEQWYGREMSLMRQTISLKESEPPEFERRDNRTRNEAKNIKPTPPSSGNPANNSVLAHGSSAAPSLANANHQNDLTKVATSVVGRSDKDPTDAIAGDKQRKVQPDFRNSQTARAKNSATSKSFPTTATKNKPEEIVSTQSNAGDPPTDDNENLGKNKTNAKHDDDTDTHQVRVKLVEKTHDAHVEDPNAPKVKADPKRINP